MSKKKQPEPLLDWKRARRDETECANRRIFETRCKRYWVVQSVGKLAGLGTTWYAIAQHPHQLIISRHRAKGPAQRACEKHYRKNK